MVLLSRAHRGAGRSPRRTGLAGVATMAWLTLMMLVFGGLLIAVGVQVAQAIGSGSRMSNRRQAWAARNVASTSPGPAPRAKANPR